MATYGYEIIDKEGKIAKVYKSVKAAGHAAKVLADLIKQLICQFIYVAASIVTILSLS